MRTEPNAIAVHTIFKSTMTGHDGAEILYGLPADSKTFFLKFLLRPFTFQSVTIIQTHVPGAATILPIDLEKGAKKFMKPYVT
jgi:hypothetical protein